MMSRGTRTGKPRIWRSRSSRILSRPTWIRGARSGSSLMAKMPRLVRGDDPEVDDLGVGVGQLLGRRLDRVDVSEQIGDRDVRSGQLFVVAPHGTATRSAPRRPPRRSERWPQVETGVQGSSLSSLPARNGTSSSRRSVSARREAALGLSAQPEQDEVVLGQQGVDDLPESPCARSPGCPEKAARRLRACRRSVVAQLLP